MKKVTRNTQKTKPDFPSDFDQTTIEIIKKVLPYTQTSPERIFALCEAVKYICLNKIPGDIVECGVWKGGSVMAIEHMLLKLKDYNREIYLFDTFDGMTPPTDKDISYIDRFICPVLYQRLAISSNGIALLCSNDEFCSHPVGDVNRESIYDIWHGQKMEGARKIHKRHKGVGLLAPCKYCYVPRKTEPVIERMGDKEVVVDKYINRHDEVGK